MSQIIECETFHSGLWCNIVLVDFRVSPTVWRRSITIQCASNRNIFSFIIISTVKLETTILPAVYDNCRCFHGNRNKHTWFVSRHMCLTECPRQLLINTTSLSLQSLLFMVTHSETVWKYDTHQFFSFQISQRAEGLCVFSQSDLRSIQKL